MHCLTKIFLHLNPVGFLLPADTEGQSCLRLVSVPETPPSFDGGFADLMNRQEMTLGLRRRLEVSQDRLMPFQGFPTMSDSISTRTA